MSHAKAITAFLVLAVLVLLPHRATAKLRSECRAAIWQKIFDSEHKREFPNLFLPETLRNVDPALATPAQLRALDTALRESRRATEGAIATLFDRLVVPVYLPGESEPRAMRFFELANKIAKEKDPAARIAPSGGVVRSVFGFLYEEMLREAERSSHFNAVEFLHRVASGHHSIFDRHGNVMAFDLRGVGSDFDILLDAKPDAFKEISESIQALFRKNGVMLHQESDPDDMNKAFFTIADLKPMKEQIDRSVRQGGASTDLLIFDLDKKVLVEPDGLHGIVDDLLQGYYRYLPPQSGRPREDPQVTTMRGPRALVEMPFLRLRPEGQKVLNQELREILRDILQNGSYPSEKAIEQINKLRRNGRLSMGNNIIQRSPANTTLGLLRSIGVALENKRQSQLLNFPTEIRFESYTPRYPLGAARAKLAERLPAKLRPYVISQADFLRDFTDDGFLYHGTSGQGALGILRGGFRQTEYEHGIRRGTYSTPEATYASSYLGRGQMGYLIQLPVKKGAPSLAFDARRLKQEDNVALRKLEADAKSHGLELADWLAKEYGVDFIILGDGGRVTLVKNTEALDRVTLPSLVQKTAEHLNKEIQNPHADFAQLMLERRRLEDSKPLFKAIGIEVGKVPSLEEFAERAVVAVPTMTDSVKILQIVEELPPAHLQRLGSHGFGGKTFPETFADALSHDPEFAVKVYRVRNGYGFSKASQAPEWKQLVLESVERMVDKASRPDTPPHEAYRWLRGIKWTLDGETNATLEARVADIVRSIPEPTLARIRRGAAEQPTMYDLLDFVEEGLSKLAKKNIDLTSDAIAMRLRQINSSKSTAEKLRGIELLSWSTDLLYKELQPEVVDTLKRIVPQVLTKDELFSSGNDLILSAHTYRPALPIDHEMKQLILRSLKAVRKAAPTKVDLDEGGPPYHLLSGVVSLAASRIDEMGLEVIAELKRLHKIYRFDQRWQGLWSDLESAFGL